MFVANPSDHRLRKGFAFCTVAAFLVQRVGNLRVGLLGCELSNLFYDLFRIPQPIGDAKWHIYENVFAGAALPPNMKQHLPRLGQSFNRDVLQQQAQ